MSLENLSTSLADAVEAVTPSLLGVPHRHGVATLTAIQPHLLVGTSILARRPPEQALLPNGEVVAIRFVGASIGLDLAVFSTEDELTPVTWSDDLRVGNLVVPVGYGPRATLGLVSQLGGAWVTSTGHAVDRFIHVDGSLPRGFGGGPLVAADGRVVGINVRRLVQGGTTLSPKTVQQAAEALSKRGSVDPGFLGVGGATATLTPAQAGVANQAEALLVIAVEPGSPADGTLDVGDIVLRVDGQVVQGVNTLRTALTGHGPGTEVALDVLSAGAVATRTVTLGERPARCG